MLVYMGSCLLQINKIFINTIECANAAVVECYKMECETREGPVRHCIPTLTHTQLGGQGYHIFHLSLSLSQ